MDENYHFPVLLLLSFHNRYDARNKGNATTWSEEGPRGFGSRAEFQAHSPDAILYLDKIAFHESGLYRCRVDFQTAQTRNSLFNLTVIGMLQINYKMLCKYFIYFILFIHYYKNQPYIYVIISVPPANPVILDKNGYKIDSPLIDPVEEGSSLALICKSNGGKKL